MMYKAIGSFIFAGGFTIGVSKYFDVLAHLEDSNYGVNTFLANHPNISVYIGEKNWPLSKYNNIDFVYANPPCAVWSQIGKSLGSNTSWKDDERLGCITKVMSLLSLNPTILVFESVTQAFKNGIDFINAISNLANRLGYSCTYLLHNAVDFGVPQVRKRFFFIAHKIELQLDRPKIRPITVEEALRHVRPDTNNFKEDGAAKAILHLYEQGGSSDKIWKQHNMFGTSKPSFGIRRLWANKPALTVTGYAVIHPTEDRFLANNELAVLCSYPETYKFVGGKSTIAQQIARGVCPKVAEHLAKCIKHSIDVNKLISQPENKLVDWL